MNVSIVCPLFNAENYIESLHKSILMQKNVEIESINYVLTESNDNTEKILKQIGASYEKISREKFSHSLVRENAALKTKGEIVVFVTQDAVIKDDNWLYKLIKPILENESEAAFSRQICDNNSIEKYTRESNYPEISRIVSKDDIEKYGIITFFFSDVSSAIRKDIYVKLNAYDGKDLITNEDMYFAYKLINNGYRIKYCSDSVVIHSHKFTLMQLLRRYFDTGVFIIQNSYFLSYKANQSALNLLKYVLKRSIEEKNYAVLFNIVPNFGARYIGDRLGKNYKKLSSNFIMKLTSSKSYWKNNRLIY